MHESCTWDEQISHAATKGRGALYVWLRMLRSPWPTAAAKAAVLPTRIAPCMWFSMEPYTWPWQATGRDTDIDTVMMNATRTIIAGTCASPTAPAYVLQGSVRPGVLLSDLGVLPARDMSRLAHARHQVRTHQADARARSDRTAAALGDPLSYCYHAMPAAAAAFCGTRFGACPAAALRFHGWFCGWGFAGGVW